MLPLSLLIPFAQPLVGHTAVTFPLEDPIL